MVPASMSEREYRGALFALWKGPLRDRQIYDAKPENSREEVLRTSDYIVNLLPSTPATRGLLNGDVLQHCRLRWVAAPGGRKKKKESTIRVVREDRSRCDIGDM